MCDSGVVVVCAQIDDFHLAIISERGIKEGGAVDTMVGCCIDGGRICGSVEECGEGGGESWRDRVHAGFREEG